MAFSLSPGVNVTEIDLTTIIPAVSTTDGAFVGEFRWGLCEYVQLVSSEDELVRSFGKPDVNNAADFFTAASFLAYGNKLRLVRAISDDAANAHHSAGSLLVKNDEEFAQLSFAGIADFFCARHPGALGNKLKVSICPSASAFGAWAYKEFFQVSPGTSSFALSYGGSNDECHVVVVDGSGLFSGLKDQVLERYSFASKIVGARKDDGSSNYWVDLINKNSKYVRVLENEVHSNISAEYKSSDASHAFTDQVVVSELCANGDDGASPADGKLEAGYDLFKNAEVIDVALVLTSDHSTNVCKYVINNICEYRKDCIALLSPLFDSVVNNQDPLTDVLADREALQLSSSYAVMDCNWKYQYDKYNDVYRWVPLNGDIAGLCVRTDTERDSWWSPAGLNRGQIKNAIKLAWNPDKADRDDLYVHGVNPVVSLAGQGIVLYGDKTLLNKPSAFDRINVRRLFIVLEKAIALAARFFLFEFNDEFTRAQFRTMVEPYLRRIKASRGLYDFRVVCDETNNTGEVIDRNEFVGDIYIKPARSINFIQLNFIAVRTGVAFEEVVGKF